jgi:hypothetical protein
MDIQLPLNGFSPSTLTKLTGTSALLKIGQQLDVQVLNTSTEAGKLSINIKIGNDTVTLNGDNFVNLTPGQTLQLQVVKLSPVPEFKLLDVKNALIPTLVNTSPTPPSTMGARSTALPPTEIRLTLSPTNTFSKPELTLPVTQPRASEPSTTQTIEFKVVGFVGNKIQLQITTHELNELTGATNQTSSPSKAPTMLIDRSQLQQLMVNTKGSSVTTIAQPATEIKIGQLMTFEISQSAGNTQFKIIPHAAPNLDTQITQFVKQFLPKHEAAPVFLNQIVKDLPQLMASPQIPLAVKTLLKSILANLPDTPVVSTEQGLKQSIKNSGLLLEAQLAMTAEKPDQQLDLDKDFKAGLLKLVQLLKQEVAVTGQQNSDTTSIDILKNLQQKTENTLAKVALDQLNNLPKEDNSKQVWNFEVPFFNKGQAESANVQIQWEKASQQEDKRPAAWSVNLTLNPPNLGTLYCTIAYQNNTVNTYFKSKSGKITDLVSSHLDLLKMQLEASGLKTGNLIAQQGSSITKTSAQLSTQKLFDEQA